ncbi:MAG TPA: NAD-dependent epimerase/dehydratase family protein [Solirubrobacteraceae bacterium]|nr:NAD-dependent epimerase/dehydratase family protein [Solirubrobacteraceae bacterium]
MSKTLVTGATGMVGSHVARALAERGDDLRLTMRPDSGRDNLAGLEYEAVTCDILDRRAVRRAMKGVDRVFHIAGTTSLRMRPELVYRINVDGTQTVLEEALRAGVASVVHTSSMGAVGPAPRGSTADETQHFQLTGPEIPYVSSKREAEVVALRLAVRGLPVVIVNPCLVFGRGDNHRSSTEIVRRFLRREIPAYVDGALNIVDATDVARGHLLAEEHGTIGERYLLGNRNYTLDRLFSDLARLSGVEGPQLKLPLPAALALAETLERLPGVQPAITTIEVSALGQWWAFRSNKAKNELGYKPTPHEDTVEATIAWFREREGSELARAGARQPLPLRATGFALRQVGGLVQRFT